jgi:recombination protein RecR
MDYPKTIKRLIELLTDLPSVGPRTAERYVFYLLKQNPEKLQELAQTIAELKEKTRRCRICGLLSETEKCEICSDQKRNFKTICVVAGTREMLSIEATKEFFGLYHVLGGQIDAIAGVKPENLNFKNLEKRVKEQKPDELILALSANLAGETTALYLAMLFKNKNIKITRLARGVPTGSELEYMDDLTLKNALKYRNEMK